jgi:GTP-binding protein
MFDEAEITVRSGKGGDGAISFRHEKFVPYGGPDGGDGGRGGNVIIKADTAMDDLRRYRQKRAYKAAPGQNGRGVRRHGRNGADIVLPVPPGTVVTVAGDDDVISADLEKAGDEVVAAAGGKGGWGNVHYKSSTNQAPRIAQRGEAGQQRTVRLELRLIADVGIIGYPNAGKSTLLASASAARPRVAEYPFTTLEPVLGMVNIGDNEFVMAEIPGLIEGAHAGRGLGHEFLRHARRTRVFIHLVNGQSASPAADMIQLNEELGRYDPALLRQPQVVAVNKIDLPEVQARLEEVRGELEAAGVRAYCISAATGQGVAKLLAASAALLVKPTVEKKPGAAPGKVFHPRPREAKIEVSRAGDGFVIAAPELERIYAGSDVGPGELRWQLNYRLKRLGADKALEKAGARPGDKIRCGDLTWEW